MNRKVTESLIKCGAFDSLKLYRSQLLAILDRAMDVGATRQKEKEGGQLSFFEVFGHSEGHRQTKTEVPMLEEWPEAQLLAFEKALLGFYLTGHPLARYEQLLKLYATTTTDNLAAKQDGVEVTLGGVISKLKVTTTKKGNERMAILGFEDFHGSVEVLVFPRTFATIESHLKLDEVLLVSGRVSLREDRPKVIAQDVIPLEQAWSRRANRIRITMPHPVERQKLETLKQMLLKHPGEIPIELTLGKGGGQAIRVAVGDTLRVDPSPNLFDTLIELVGVEGIVIVPRK